MTLRDKAAIAGLGTTEFSKNSGRSEYQLALEAVTAALVVTSLGRARKLRHSPFPAARHWPRCWRSAPFPGMRKIRSRSDRFASSSRMAPARPSTR